MRAITVTASVLGILVARISSRAEAHYFSRVRPANLCRFGRRHGRFAPWGRRCLDRVTVPTSRNLDPPNLDCLDSLPILLSDLVTVHPGRPAALPTAAGWDEELRARTAGVRLPQPGDTITPSHRLGWIHPYVRSCSAAGTDRERSGWRT